MNTGMNGCGAMYHSSVVALGNAGGRQASDDERFDKKAKDEPSFGLVSLWAIEFFFCCTGEHTFHQQESFIVCVTCITSTAKLVIRVFGHDIF